LGLGELAESESEKISIASFEELIVLARIESVEREGTDKILSLGLRFMYMYRSFPELSSIMQTAVVECSENNCLNYLTLSRNTPSAPERSIQ
jgi:hypothetical protein